MKKQPWAEGKISWAYRQLKIKSYPQSKGLMPVRVRRCEMRVENPRSAGFHPRRGKERQPRVEGKISWVYRPLKIKSYPQSKGLMPVRIRRCEMRVENPYSSRFTHEVNIERNRG